MWSGESHIVYDLMMLADGILKSADEDMGLSILVMENRVMVW